ncbi:ammonium transporter [Ornithinimicrobium tianjinense]|uniref:Ammonium transporter n=1 Tax=Ornithinimicrobium tianjinense TaxID=1195761 RepID=A0A917BGK7_9MICO|nr:ammonium transporter [Ornithinimicrobium tianjinense]GGF38261.1 ammonium transporter [Ornithinimicrobium tianjinense]
MELTAGDVWVMVSAALVLLMTPGLAFFYGGMARAKAALNMIMMSFVSVGVVGVVWVLWGYGMTSAPGILGGLVGNPVADLGLAAHVGTGELIGIGYAATFAIITVALISGAVADRTRFGSWSLFVPVWVTLVYCPLAFMVWGGGLLSADGLIGRTFGEAIDFAGGTVVHINAGLAALVLVMIIGSRADFGQTKGYHRPHNVPLVMIGTAMLWFGWFGFNGGAAGTAEEAGLIWVNTMVAPAAAMLAWLLTERVRDGRPTSIGAASGVVAGLVAITPACASVSPLGAVVIGALAGVGSALAVGWKYRFGYDDALDVVGVHLVSGVIGTLAIGFLALPVDGEGGGLFYGGGAGQLVAQVAATVFTLVFTGVMTAVIGLAIARTLGFRVSAEDEARGVDLSEHAESAYSFGEESASYEPLVEDARA